MPILKIKGLDVANICKISKELIDELQELLQCPRDYFSLSAEQALYIRDGEIVDGDPVVEVSWFDRGQEVQDKAAEIVTRYIISLGYSSVDVIFVIFDENRYYENGKHF